MSLWAFAFAAAATALVVALWMVFARRDADRHL
jgi:hypothetical protein